MQGNDDIRIRVEGVAGRITLTRPKALNALSYDMCLEVEKAIDLWRDDDAVKIVIIDGEGERAFCAGGDIQEMYDTGTKGDFSYGRKFWFDEYRLNAKIKNYPKPYVAFMQGFTMGGGVGVSCHGAHRIVGESSQMAMPEVGIGLIPDVGGSYILANAPGRLGEYYALSGARMNAEDAIYVGFADMFIPEENWGDLKTQLCQTGDVSILEAASKPAPEGQAKSIQKDVDWHFAGESFVDILQSLEKTDSEFAQKTLKTLNRNSPLSCACTVEILHRQRPNTTIEKALDLEYRFTHRSAEQGDFLEGIRAQIIDKDRNPKWKHASGKDVPTVEISNMLMPIPGVKLEV